MANNIQTVVRTAAMIYAEEQAITTIKSVKRRFINAVLVNANNSPLTIEEIITRLQSEHELVYIEEEIQGILEDSRHYEVILGKKRQENKYYLSNNKFDTLKKKSEYCIDDAIGEFILDKESVKTEELRELLHRYLYSLLNTNIKAYSQLLEKKGKKVSPVIDANSFDEDEIELINDFIQWDNPQKDRALFELVNYCIDYACAINSIDPQDIVIALKNKKLYLDNALIYRALGINGEFRKDRAQNLLQRCVSSGQQLLISSITRNEFFETIDYHISHLRESAPYGHINPELFRRYTGGYTIYQYYHEWRRTKNTYAYDLFRIHIKNEYDSLVKKFNIIEDFKQKFSEEEDTKIERYADEIESYKRQKNSSLLLNDAKNMVWIEHARNGCDSSVRDTKFYFVTTDRRLQEWDLTHSNNQPITMLPSQWLALLLKYFSHSNNDFKSFVSFLSLPTEKGVVSADELQNILAGISEITEEFEKQEDVISDLIELNEKNRFNDRENVKNFTKSKIEDEYREKLKIVEDEYQRRLDETKIASEQLLNDRLEQMLAEFRVERKKDRIERIDEKINNCEIRLREKQNIDNRIKANCNNRRKALIWLFIAILILYPVSMLILTYYAYDWNKMEPITWFVGIIITVSVLICSLIMNKNFEFWKIPSEFYNMSVAKLRSKYNIEVSEISDLEETLSIQKKEKEKLEQEQ